MTAVRGAWFAPVGTPIADPGFDGRLGPGWEPRVPGPKDEPVDVTAFGWWSDSCRVVPARQRWEFTTVLDLGDPDDPGDPPCRVWLPRVELKPDDSSGVRMTMWYDPEMFPLA